MFGIVGIATAAISVIVSIIFWVIAGSNVSTDFEKEFMKDFDEGYEYYNDDDSYEDYDYDYDSLIMTILIIRILSMMAFIRVNYYQIITESITS